ncbi:hypothetical protein FACS18949_07000 [Clostridia bacterium]|nr:hypothetical protein FACS189425_05430 [Clostridia bacterium]GHV33331.1 hypothetical protein FACS18949_07000 [Clostridia bacterium]
METTILKDYLAALIDRYKAVYTANQVRKSIKERINHLRNENSNAIEALPEPPVMPETSNGGVNVLKALGIGLAVFVGGYFVVGCVVGIIGFITGLSAGVFIGVAVICFLVACGVTISRIADGTKENSEAKAAYEKAKAAYEKAKEDYPLIVEAHKEKVRQRKKRTQSNAIVIDNLQQESEHVAAAIHDAETTIGTLYDKGVVFEKYRHFVAVATFYEYLMSGRCETLEGRDGAYNLYETELRQNIIIGKIDEILDRLSEIRDTQYVMCSAIQESNRISSEIASELSNIKSSLNAIEGSSASVAKSAKLTEFYAAENARNSKTLVDLNRGDFDSLVTKGGRHIIA